MKSAYRLLAGFIALAALVLQYWLMATRATSPPQPIVTVNFFSYFTILSNILVALAMLLPVCAAGSQLGRFFDRAGVRAAIALYILVVGIVYHMLLRGLWDPQGLQLVVDMTLHTVTPVLFIADWIFFSGKRGLRFTQVPYWLIYPAVFGAYSIIRGAFTGFYPYPFLDAGTLGYGAVAVNMLGMLVGFSIGGALFVLAGRRLVQG